MTSASPATNPAMPAALPQKRIPQLPNRPWAFIKYLCAHLPARTLWQLGGCIGMGALTTLCLLAITWIFGRTVNAILAGPSESVWERLMPYLVAVFALNVVLNLAFRLWDWLARRCMPDYVNEVRNLLFNRLLQQSQGFLHNNFAGVLANHVRRAGEVMAALFERIAFNFVPLTIRFIGTGFLLWKITPWLALLILIFVCIAVGGSMLAAPRWSKLSELHAANASALSGHIVDSITNLLAVQQNAAWSQEQHHLQTVQDKLTASFSRRSVFTSWFWGGFNAFGALFFVGFMALIAYGWQKGDIDAGQLAMAAALVTQLFHSLEGTVQLLTVKMDDIGVLRDSLAKISTPLDVMDAQDADDLKVSRGAIHFDHINFAYGNGQNVFTNLDLAIQPGQRVGLVGVSGAGKTSLCQLLLRAYDPQIGRVTIDGQDIARVTQDSLHTQIAVIPQEPMLFHRTLAENIAYGQPGVPIDMDRVRKAAAAAQADKFIDVLPQGYDTLVGERGVKLSGGQRQRVAIARAIYKNAPILLLDEATSALDSETEQDIQKAMLQAMEGRTTLVVAHRLSTISHLDRIVVMEQGRVVEDGDFKTLLETNGIFAKLWKLQAGGFIADHL